MVMLLFLYCIVLSEDGHICHPRDKAISMSANLSLTLHNNSVSLYADYLLCSNDMYDLYTVGRELCGVGVFRTLSVIVCGTV